MKREKIKNLMEKYSILISIILGVLFIWGYNLIFIQDTNFIGFNTGPNNPMCLILTIGVSALIYYNRKYKNKRLWIIAGIVGILFAITYYLGDIQNYYIRTAIPAGKKFLLFSMIKILTYTVLFTNVVFWLFDKVPALIRKFASQKEPKFFTNNAKSFWLVFFLFFLSYVPFFLYYYPGNINTDNMWSFYQVTGIKPYTNFQPIVYTFIFGGLWNLGKAIFGTPTAGVAVYTIFQMICSSLVFSTVLYYMAKRRVSVKWRIVTFLFLILNPMNGWFTVRAEKGMLFHLSFILVILGIIDMIHDPRGFFEKKWKPIGFVAITLLMVFIRNNGLYALLLTVPFIIWADRKIWKKVLATFGTVLVIVFLIQGVVFKAFHIDYSSPAEALAVPIQQYARVAKYASDRISDQDRQVIEKYFNVGVTELGESYTPWFTDTAKWNFSAEAFEEDKVTFVKQYFKFAFKFPLQTISAFVFTNGNNYSPNFNAWGIVRTFGNETQTIYTTVGKNDKGTFENFVKTYPIENKHLVNFSYLDVLNDKLTKIPLISDLLSNIGWYFWLLVLCFAYCIYRKKYKEMVMLIPIAGLWLTAIAAPVVDLRYIYPMFLTIPLFIGIIGESCREQEKNTSEICKIEKKVI